MRQSRPDPVEVGKRLRELRGIRTRIGVSRETGIPYSTLQSYEDGFRNPPEKTQQLLADYYGVTPESIFCTPE